MTGGSLDCKQTIAQVAAKPWAENNDDGSTRAICKFGEPMLQTHLKVEPTFTCSRAESLTELTGKVNSCRRRL